MTAEKTGTAAAWDYDSAVEMSGKRGRVVITFDGAGGVTACAFVVGGAAARSKDFTTEAGARRWASRWLAGGSK